MRTQRASSEQRRHPTARSREECTRGPRRALRVETQLWLLPLSGSGAGRAPTPCGPPISCSAGWTDEGARGGGGKGSDPAGGRRRQPLPGAALSRDRCRRGSGQMDTKGHSGNPKTLRGLNPSRGGGSGRPGRGKPRGGAGLRGLPVSLRSPGRTAASAGTWGRGRAGRRAAEQGRVPGFPPEDLGDPGSISAPPGVAGGQSTLLTGEGE